jgi:hypothetical protein
MNRLLEYPRPADSEVRRLFVDRMEMRIVIHLSHPMQEGSLARGD